MGMLLRHRPSNPSDTLFAEAEKEFKEKKQAKAESTEEKTADKPVQRGRKRKPE